MAMLTATQFDIFGSERAADPTGRRRSLTEHKDRCNLCCVPFENTELPPVGHFFYLGFHICERCHNAFTEAAEDKRAGRKVVKWLDVDFMVSNKIADGDVENARTIAVVVNSKIFGFLGRGDHLTRWIGRTPHTFPFKFISDTEVTEQLFNIAADTGVLGDKSISIRGYRYDFMIAEMYDNIAYNRLDFNDVKEA